MPAAGESVERVPELISGGVTRKAGGGGWLAICARANAQTRMQKEVEAEYDAKEWAKPVVPGEWQAMKKALEKELGAPLDDKLCPAKEYLQRLKQVSIGRRP